VLSVIDQLADAGTLEISFTGGEVLIREDFFDIASYARKKNMAVSLLSNGTLLDEKAVEKMKQLHFSVLSISLYGATPEVHEVITGKAGSFSTTVKAITLLKHSGFKVQVKTVVMKQNLDEITKLGRFCDDIGVELFADPRLCPATNGSLRPLKYRLSNEELRRYMVWEAELGKEVHGLTEVCNAGICNVGISPQGKVFPCIAWRLEAGDLRLESFAQVWSGSPVLKWLRSLKMEDFWECSRCELLDTCKRCPGQALFEEGNCLAPCQELCRCARMRQEARKWKSQLPK